MQGVIWQAVAHFHCGTCAALEQRSAALPLQVQFYTEQATGVGVRPVVLGHRDRTLGTTRHVKASSLSDLTRAVDRHRALLALVAVDQGVVGPASQHPVQAPGQVGHVQRAGGDAQPPHRGDQVRGVAHEEHTPFAPAAGDAMVHAIDDLVDHLHLVHVANEGQRLLQELVIAGRVLAWLEGIKKTPALGVAHQDHPLLRIGEIGEVGIVSRVADVQVELQIDQGVFFVERVALGLDAQCAAHTAATAVTGQHPAAFGFERALRGLELERHMVAADFETHQLVA